MSQRRTSNELSPHEDRTVQLRSEGLTFKEVAARMHITEHTAKQYMCQAREKSGKSPFQLVTERARQPKCEACSIRLRLLDIEGTLAENGFATLTES